ncbi:MULTISPECIES: hypothetical protein [Stenotrophomonas]|uniref:HTH luxR-type domain-containing protein n=1 Tax=Stenotrophomonas bentonitica TaxID=1450134 RepID=A0ABU9JND8_9GAMM|nr:MULTISPECIES: hypothetical protein [Stenotrophomonas]MCX2918791.1 hypothetical protein [Stenotrophomonas rhizophila]WIA61425.1 hypothetical protein POS15_19180 [Stenotrophomonas sp. BIO128-Bstrain]
MKAELMEELYAGVTDPERMQSFVERLGRAVGCHSGSVTLRDVHGGRHRALVAAGAMADPRTVERFNEDTLYSVDNLWFNRAAPTMRAGSVIVSDRVATLDEMRGTRYYLDFLRQIDTLRSVALCASRKPDQVTMLTFVGTERRGDFDAREVALCEALAPHFVNAFELRQALQDAWRQAGTLALLLLDENLRPVSVNAGGEEMLLARVLRVRRKAALEPVHPASRAGWNALVRRLALRGGPAQDPGEDIVALHDADGLLAGFASLRPYGKYIPGTGTARFVMTVNTLVRRSSAGLSATLRELFGLTPGEATLAVALHHQGELSAAAATCGIGVGSARTRLQSIFEKTRLHRQVDLVRMLDTLNGMLASERPLPLY